MNLEIGLTPYMMSSLVIVKYIRIPTRLLNNVGSIVYPLSSLLGFKHVITGVVAALKFDILNIFKIVFAYLDCDMKIPLSYY